MDTLETLVELFKKFPGIGPRQARRFVFYLLRKDSAYLTDFADSVRALKKHIGVCEDCLRFFPKKTASRCRICADTGRDSTQLMVVADDVDIDAVEKSGAYKGYYFVLGGLMTVLEKAESGRVRLKELMERVKGMKKLNEVILALDVNPEGEYTLEHISATLSPLASQRGFIISRLGRGLSTGTELEYSDAETLKNALTGRLKNQ